MTQDGFFQVVGVMYFADNSKELTKTENMTNYGNYESSLIH
jgi:hypothetical protein